MSVAPGEEIILQGDGFGRIWNAKPRLTDEGLISTFVGESPFTGVSFSAGSENIALVDSKGSLVILRVKQNRFSLLVRSGHPCESVLFSRRSKREVFVSFEDHTVRSYSIDHGQLQGTLKGHRCTVQHMAVRSTVDEMITCSTDGIVIWDLRTLTRRRTLGPNPFGALTALFSEDGEYVVTAFKDDTLWVWDASTFALRYRVRAPLGPQATPGCLRAVAVSPDSSHMAVGGVSPLLVVYDFSRGFVRHAVELPTKHALRGILQAQFLPDSETLAVLCADGALLFVNVLDPKIEYAIESARPPRTDARSFSLDERANYAALIGHDGKARLYDLARVRSGYSTVQGSPALRLKKVGADGVAVSGPESMEAVGEGDRNLVPGGDRPAGLGGAEGASSRLVSSAIPRRGMEMKGWRQEAAEPRMMKHPVAPGSGPAVPVSAPPADRSRPLRPPREPPAAAAAQRALSRRRLRDLLDGFGEYPERYRNLIWRQLLGLPGNTAAYQALASRGLHTAYETLGEKYPLSDRALLSRLARTLSALAHWAPVFSELPYLPAFAFPFVKAFGADELACFEALATLFLNQARGWFDLFPAPPVSVLSKLEALLAHHDPELHAAMLARLGGVQGHAWCMLQTAFSEVLSRKEWHKAWDHILTSEPSFLLYLSVSYLVYFREHVMRAGGEDQVALFIRRQNSIDLNAVIKGAYEIRARTPPTLHPQAPPMEKLPADSPVYPPYNCFPPAAVDLALRERERIANEERDLARRRTLVKDLEDRGRTLAAQEAAWVQERARLAELEADRRAALRRQEEEMAVERGRLDDRARGERLKQVAVVEEAYRGNLQRLRSEWQVELEELRADIEHKKRMMEHEARSKKEEEAVNSLEFQAQQRIWAMEEEAERQAAAQRLRTAVEAAQADEYAKKSQKAAAWEAEDGERRLLLSQEAARRARAARLEAEMAAREEAEALMIKNTIGTDATLAALEAQRRLRKLQEDAALADGEKEAAKRARESLRLGQDKDHFARELAATRAEQEAAAAKRAAALEEAELLRRAEAAAREARGADVAHTMRRRELEAQLEEHKRLLDRERGKEERETRLLLEVLEEERRRDRALESELRLREEELGVRLARVKEAGERQGSAEEDERRRFERMRSELADRAAAEEGAARRRHEEAMASLALERERQLMELDSVWRKTAASEELRLMARQKAELDKDLVRRAQDQVDREASLAREVEGLRARVEGRDAVPKGGAGRRGGEEDEAGRDQAFLEALFGPRGRGKENRPGDDSVSMTITESQLSDSTTPVASSVSADSRPSKAAKKARKQQPPPESPSFPTFTGNTATTTPATADLLSTPRAGRHRPGPGGGVGSDPSTPLTNDSPVLPAPGPITGAQVRPTRSSRAKQAAQGQGQALRGSGNPFASATARAAAPGSVSSSSGPHASTSSSSGGAHSGGSSSIPTEDLTRGGASVSRGLSGPPAWAAAEGSIPAPIRAPPSTASASSGSPGEELLTPAGERMYRITPLPSMTMNPPPAERAADAGRLLDFDLESFDNMTDEAADRELDSLLERMRAQLGRPVPRVPGSSEGPSASTELPPRGGVPSWPPAEGGSGLRSGAISSVLASAPLESGILDEDDDLLDMPQFYHYPGGMGVDNIGEDPTSPPYSLSTFATTAFPRGGFPDIPEGEEEEGSASDAGGAAAPPPPNTVEGRRATGPPPQATPGGASVSGSSGGTPSSGNDPDDPTPRHTRAYLLAREILARHRSGSGSGSAPGSGAASGSDGGAF